MLTGTTISGAAMVVGLGGAALLLAQPYLTRRFPRLAAWLPAAGSEAKPAAVSAAPTLAAVRIDSSALAELAEKVSRVEETLTEKIARIAARQEETLNNEEASDGKETLDEIRTRIGTISDNLRTITVCENNRRLRDQLDKFKIDMKELDVNLFSDNKDTTGDEGDRLVSTQNKLSSISAKIERLFGMHDVTTRMMTKANEVADEARRGQLTRDSVMRVTLQRQFNLLDGVLEDCYGMLDGSDKSAHEWLSGWQRRESQRRAQEGQA